MILKPIEVKNYYPTDNSGTDPKNPEVKELPKAYKVALYLGYSLKWDYKVIEPYWADKNEKAKHHLVPIFKKSHDRIDFFYLRRWHEIFKSILPQMKKDGLISDKLKDVIFELDEEKTMLEIIKIIDKQIKDIKSPFLNIKKLPVQSSIY